MPDLGLTNKEIAELRIKCLEPYVIIASKANIEQDTVIDKAEIAWNYVVKGLVNPGTKKTPGKSQPSTQKKRS